MSLLCGNSLWAATTVALEEDFNGFTEGSEKTPGTDELVTSGKLASVLPGWSGEGLYSAGGSVFVGSTDIFDIDDHYIQTPALNLDKANGPVVVTLRVRSSEAYGNMIYVYSGSTKLDTPYFEDDEWHTFSIMTDKDVVEGLKIYSASRFSTPFFIDYLKVEQSSDYLMPPTALRPVDYDGNTFTARWLSVANAAKYEIVVYNKDDDGNLINKVTYEADPLPEGDTSGNRLVVTVADNSLKYYFYVIARSASGYGSQSGEAEVIKLVESLDTPTALPATNVTDNSFTANWQAVADADTYTATLYKTVTVQEESNIEVLNEDFSGITQGDWDLISLPDEDPAYLDDYTKDAGWYAKYYAFGGGRLVLWPMFSAAYFVTPAVDLSANEGVAFVDFTAAVGSDGKYKTGDKITVELLKQENGETTVVDSQEVEIDEAAFKNYGVMFTDGFKGAFIRFTYSGDYEAHFDDVVITQKLEAGAKVRTAVKQVATSGLSADFDYAPAANTEYSYTVTASVNTISKIGMDEVVTSETSNEIVVGDSSVDSLSADGLKAFARNGQLVVIAPEVAPVAIYDASGRVVASFVARQGENVVDCHGFVIVRSAGKAVKAVVK